MGYDPARISRTLGATIEGRLHLLVAVHPVVGTLRDWQLGLDMAAVRVGVLVAEMGTPGGAGA